MSAVSAERAVRITAGMYETRRVARAILGQRFRTTMLRCGDMIKKLAGDAGISETSAAIHIAKNVEAAGHAMTAVYVIAALVELIEPSEDC